MVYSQTSDSYELLQRYISLNIVEKNEIGQRNANNKQAAPAFANMAAAKHVSILYVKCVYFPPN